MINVGPSVLDTPLSPLLPVTHRGNWRGDAARLPRYLIRGMGGHVEEVTARLVVALQTTYPGQMHIGWAGESSNIPGHARTLRVQRGLAPGHLACADIEIHEQGGDLSVCFTSRPRTYLAWVRIGIYAGLFVSLFVLGYSAYLGYTDQIGALARDFAHKMAVNGNDAILFRKLRYGEYSQTGKPWTFLDYFSADPGLFLLDVSRVPTILAAVIGFGLKRLPPDLFRTACRFMGLPDPDEFQAKASVHISSISNVMDQMLWNDYQIEETAKIPW